MFSDHIHKVTPPNQWSPHALLFDSDPFVPSALSLCNTPAKTMNDEPHSYYVSGCSTYTFAENFLLAARTLFKRFIEGTEVDEKTIEI